MVLQTYTLRRRRKKKNQWGIFPVCFAAEIGIAAPSSTLAPRPKAPQKSPGSGATPTGEVKCLAVFSFRRLARAKSAGLPAKAALLRAASASKLWSNKID